LYFCASCLQAALLHKLGGVSTALIELPVLVTTMSNKRLLFLYRTVSALRSCHCGVGNLKLLALAIRDVADSTRAPPFVCSATGKDGFKCCSLDPELYIC